MENDEGKIPVLYIMGTARSGSTILEILLAHGEGAFGAGELTALAQDGLIENKGCSCGDLFDKCEVWGAVRRELDLSPDELKVWARLQKRIEWHHGFFLQLFGLISQQEWNRYKKYNQKLFKSVQKATEMEVIVDSSKYAGRAMALSRMPGVDLKIICLTRSPEGLMTSFQKPNKGEQQKPKKPFSVLTYYCMVLLSLRIAAWKVKAPVYNLEYDDFISDPHTVLVDISSWSGINLTDASTKLRKNAFFSVGHIVTGNRLKNCGKVKVGHRPGKLKAHKGVYRLIISCMNIWKTIMMKKTQGGNSA